TKAVAAASAKESGPPEQATNTRASEVFSSSISGVSVSRTACRARARIGSNRPGCESLAVLAVIVFMKRLRIRPCFRHRGLTVDAVNPLLRVAKFYQRGHIAVVFPHRVETRASYSRFHGPHK